jgi:hypothetical protein
LEYPGSRRTAWPRWPRWTAWPRRPQGSLSGPPGITAENANPMAYALVHRTGTIDEERSFGISQADVFLEPEGTTYCFTGPRPKVIQVTLEVEETTKPRQPGETFPVPPPGSWNSMGYQPDPPATPGSLSNPIVITGLGRGLDCPAGTEFYVQGFSDTRDYRGYVAFFLSLVL